MLLLLLSIFQLSENPLDKALQNIEHEEKEAAEGVQEVGCVGAFI